MSNPTVSFHEVPDASGRPTRRSAAIGLAVTLLIAAGSYGATHGHGAAPRRADVISPSPRAAHELRDVIVHLYGPRVGGYPVLR
jgi:hypothetical protein